MAIDQAHPLLAGRDYEARIMGIGECETETLFGIHLLQSVTTLFEHLNIQSCHRYHVTHMLPTQVFK